MVPAEGARGMRFRSLFDEQNVDWHAFPTLLGYLVNIVREVGHVGKRLGWDPRTQGVHQRVRISEADTWSGISEAGYKSRRELPTCQAARAHQINGHPEGGLC
jgi:hypothetical protein